MRRPTLRSGERRPRRDAENIWRRTPLLTPLRHATYPGECPFTGCIASVYRGDNPVFIPRRRHEASVGWLRLSRSIAQIAPLPLTFSGLPLLALSGLRNPQRLMSAVRADESAGRFGLQLLTHLGLRSGFNAARTPGGSRPQRRPITAEMWRLPCPLAYFFPLLRPA